MNAEAMDAAIDLARKTGGRRFHTVLADPPWRFTNRTGKVAPEHRRLSRYETMTTEDICALPVADLMWQPAHLYLWVPNALLPDGLRVLTTMPASEAKRDQPPGLTFLFNFADELRRRVPLP